jgi:2-dehydro-3-deoxyphosphogluconate aldolase/(4S)-4-hydroxy-2-oxoglutarate aldolase
VACGIGSNMITKKLLDAKDYQGIEDNVRKTIALSKTIKAELAAK